MLRRVGISVFVGPETATLGRRLTVAGEPSGPARCSGRIGAAVADPLLGPGGVRVGGVAWFDDTGEVLRVVLADQHGVTVGLATGGPPDGDRRVWRGYAVAPVGADLTAYAVLPDRALCRLNSVDVAPSGSTDVAPSLFER